MLRLVVLACAVLVGAHAQSSQVSSCTASSGNLPLYTFIERCETTPCVLPQKQDFVLHAFFNSPLSLDSMSTQLTFYLSLGAVSIPIPFDLRELSRTCNFLNNASCPVNEGEFLHYTFRLHVDELFPQGKLAPIELRVVDDATQEPVFCVRVRVLIGAPLSIA